MRDGKEAQARGLGIGGLKPAAAPKLERGVGLPVLHTRTPRMAGTARATPALRTGPGVVLDVTPVGPSVRIFRVGRPEGFTFQAGQSVKLGLERATVRRRYSIASAPHEGHLEFCIESVPGGRLSSHLFELVPGEPLALAREPKGSFALRADRRRHVMVATVTGIAPLRSMLRDALSGASALAARAGAEPGEFWVLHGASYADELPYADELAELASRDARVHYLPTISRPGATRNQGWSGQQGRVDALVLPTLRALGAKHDVAVYACGHPEMVRGVRETLEPLDYLVLSEAYA